MSGSNVVVIVTKAGTAVSPYPPSFGDNPYMFAGAFAAILAASVFAIIVMWWMSRDIWRDRRLDHPRSLAFQFRIMVMVVATATFVRGVPEVVYMTFYNDPNGERWLGVALTVKRSLDILALPLVTTWMAILVSIYPFVILSVRDWTFRTVKVDMMGLWPRAARPVVIFILVLVIASLMAVAKRYGMRQ